MPAGNDLLSVDKLYYVKLLSDSSTDGILLLGRNYRILAFNNTAEKLSIEIYKKHYHHGDDFRYYINPAAEEHFHRQFNNALNGNITEEVFDIDKADGKNFLKVQMTPVYNDAGEVNAVAIVTKDITVLTNLNTQLEEIAAIQNHQVRRPVANMLSLVELLESDNLTTQQVEYLQLLKTSILQLEDEIHSIVKKTRNRDFAD